MRLFTKRGLLASALVAASLVAMPLVRADSDWGPSRPTFTWANPATYVTFNSITDNPTVGDERTFFTAYPTNVNNNGQNDLTVTDNEEVTLRAYFHNNAASNLGLVAHNTRVKVALPTTAATDQTETATISADNANPGAVFDNVHLHASTPFTLTYQTGSAKLFNNVFTNGTPLSDSIVTGSGAQVGYNAIDGNVPGCAQFSGWVVLHVVVHFKPVVNPNFACNLLDIDKENNRTVKVTKFTTTAKNGATFKDAVIDWGDGSTPLTTNTAVGQTHKYAKNGKYTVSAVAHFTVDGQDKTASSDSCAKSINFTSKPTPTPPKQLVNTGAGNVIGLFAAVSVASAVAYRWMLGRRLGNQ